MSAMPRLAWFTPFPPDRSGIAAYSAEVLPLLARTHEIDVFINRAAPQPDSEPPPRAQAASGFEVRDAHEFPWRHARAPYDLTVYQLGNGRSHDYIWGYLPHHPGLTVLHDAQVHQARAEHLFARGRLDDYGEELRFCHPGVPETIRDLVVAGLGGQLFCFWPLIGIVMRTARVVAVHHRWLASSLGESYPSVPVEMIRMGVPGTTGDGGRVRAAHGIPPASVVFAAFGRVTPEKRITEALRALAQVAPRVPEVRLLLVGERADYYDVEAEARAAGVAGRVTITGYVPDEELPDYVDAADACLCLRWPTGRETSASWLRCVAAGKATIVTDLAQMSEVPALDPRSWTRLAAHHEGDTDPDTAERPIAVALDILDEQHSLGLAMHRLATDVALRQELGANARAFWQRGATLEHMATDYERAIARALGVPRPDLSGLPAHLTADGTGLARTISARIGVKVDFLGQ
jgi:glycosyltransferase involved in cell wall biosynthesis